MIYMYITTVMHFLLNGGKIFNAKPRMVSPTPPPSPVVEGSIPSAS